MMRWKCNPLGKINAKRLSQNRQTNICIFQINSEPKSSSNWLVCDRGALPIFCFLINHQEKIWGEWVQTRGYLALRILHADTLTRLLSGSAHEAQTFLDNLWKPKKSATPPYIDNNFPSMVKLLYLCMTDSLGGGWLSWIKITTRTRRRFCSSFP